MSALYPFPEFPVDCRSLLSKHLTPELFGQLKSLRTDNGYRLSQLINSGVINVDSNIGVYAGDADCYRTFADLLDPIIQEYHGFAKSDRHISNLNTTELNVGSSQLSDSTVISTRIRVARNLADYPMGAALSQQQRMHLEQQVCKAFQTLGGQFSGHYYSLNTIDGAQRQRLVDDHFLFKAGDRFLEAAGLNRDWPQGRGIFHNNDKTFLVWVNEEDHLRIISMQPGGDIQQVFTRLSNGLKLLEKSLDFEYDEHLGYLTSCPTNLGTAMRCSVHIRLPNLANDKPRFRQIAADHELQIRGVDGEHSDSADGIFDISNRRRLGVSEVECLQQLHDGVIALIAVENQLSH